MTQYNVLIADVGVKSKCLSYTLKIGDFPMSHNIWSHVQQILLWPGGNLWSIKPKLKESFNFSF